MAKTRQRRSAQFKFQVALEALKEQKTLSQLASEYEVHPTQITQWKKQLLDGGSSLFGQQRVRELHARAACEAELILLPSQVRPPLRQGTLAGGGGAYGEWTR